MEFDYNNIPPHTKLLHAIHYRKIIGEAADVKLDAPDLYESIQELGWKMVKTCVVDGGVGLAAPQLGFPKKIFIMLGFDDPYLWAFNGKFSVFINPSWTAVPGTEKKTEAESCLSVPGQTFAIIRPQEIDVTYWTFNEKNKLEKVVDRLTGHPSRIYQHEHQHCFGSNIVDMHDRQVGLLKKKKNGRR